MPNTRIIGQQLAVFAGPSPATGSQPSDSMVQLYRNQGVSMDWQITRQNINQIGDLSPISQEILDSPNVTMDTSWSVSNLRNESGVGFYITTSPANQSGCLTNIINGTQDTKNYYIKLAPQGQDANRYAGTDCAVIASGNANIASYSTSAAVGGLPTSNLSVAGLNVEYDTSCSGVDSPAINPNNGVNVVGTYTLPPGSTGVAGQTTVLRPGDLRLSMRQGGADYVGLGISTVCIQSYQFNFSLALEPQQCLGSRFPTNRYATFPVEITATIEAQVKDFGSGSLASLLCNDREVDIIVTLADPACGTGIGADKVRFSMLGAKPTSQPFVGGIQGNSTVTFNFTSLIGGPTDTSHNFIMSGSIA